MFDFDKVSVSKFYVAPPVERIVEFSPPGIDMTNISRVLSLAASAQSHSADVYDGYVQVSGRTRFCLSYLDKDGNPKGVDYNADFTVRVDGEFQEGDSVNCNISVVESDVKAEGALSLSAVLEVSISATRRGELEFLKDANNCYKTMTEVTLPAFIATKSIVSPFEDEFEVGGEISAVLGLCSNVAVKKAIVSNGSAQVAADVCAIVTYVVGGEIKQHPFKIRLDEEFAIDEAQEGDHIIVHSCVKNAKVILQGVTDDNTIKIEGEVQYRVQIMRSSKTEVVCDLFSLTNEIDISREKQEYICYDGCTYVSESVSGTAVLGDNKAAVLHINALPHTSCYTTKAYFNDDGNLAVEGIASTDIIYTDENGYNSVRTEIPFSVVIDGKIPQSKKVRVHCLVEDIDTRIRKEREIDVSLRLAAEVQCFSSAQAAYISGVEIGAEKPQNRSAMSLYIAKDGDEIIDLCKALTAMPEAIIAQNPELRFPLSEGDRVLYFRTLEC